MTSRRLRLVIFQEEPGLWIVRGLEHNVGAEARTSVEAIRAAMRFVDEHTAVDIRRDHLPLSSFPPAAQKYWNAYAAGTAVPLTGLGVSTPTGWDIQAAFATSLSADSHASRSNGGMRLQHAR
jgi:hypothetical protein